MRHKAISKHIEIPKGNRARTGLFPITLTIPLDDWRRARQTNPLLPTAVTETMATDCLSFCFKRGVKVGAKFYHLYFDRGERHHGHISDRYRSRKVKREVALYNRVAHLDESDMRDVPALQMADLFAWPLL